MEGFILRGWNPVRPRLAVAPRSPTNQRLARGVGVSTPRGAASIRGVAVFYPAFVGSVDVWKDFCSGGDTLSSAVAAPPRRFPEW